MTTTHPLVSVICLSYNNAAYVKEALLSVLQQDYPNIELIIIDDASEDHSVAQIKQVIPQIKIPYQCIVLPHNLGVCKAFNIGLAHAKGEYVIDLASDDVLLPNRVRHGVHYFSKQPEQVGVCFCNVIYMDANGKELGLHFSDQKTYRNKKIKEGDVFAEVIRRFYISAPGMLMRRTVLEKVGGYNEALTFEDFDFWVRSARITHYAYENKPLIKKRVINESLSNKIYVRESKHLQSILIVCQTAYRLLKNRTEALALKERITYELSQTLNYRALDIAEHYFQLNHKLSTSTIYYSLVFGYLRCKYWFIKLFSN